ncbi:MAG TPA: hypothetical protein VNA24_06805 [Hyalangium sp.]|jgi:hypothetical protein|nr:hypothetical protein [Hyalangium sp.]
MTQGKDPTGGGGGAPGPRAPNRPIEEIRAEIMNDPDVREQARIMDIPLEKYVDKIIDYARNPNKPAQVVVKPDAVLKKEDPTIPTTEEIKTHLEKLASGEIAVSPAHKRDGFEKTQRDQGRYEEATGTAKARKDAPESAPPAQDETPYKLPDMD